MFKKILQRLRLIENKPIAELDDEFIIWLRFANAGMLENGNIHCFEYALQHLPSDHPVLEIGSFCGLSTNVIAYFLQKHGKPNKIITSDQWDFEGAGSGTMVGDSSMSHKSYKAFVKDSFKNNVSAFSKHNLPYAIELISDEFFNKWATTEVVQDVFNREIKLGGPISFVYVDGNHTYEYARRDFEHASRYLENGGFILFDDSHERSPFGCAALMKDVVKNPDYKVVLKNPNYLFQKIN